MIADDDDEERGIMHVVRQGQSIEGNKMTTRGREDEDVGTGEW